MAWDANRPVPWQRLVREWMLYVGIMAVVFVIFFRNDGLIGILGGLLASGPLYLAFGYVLAKFGYQRKTLKELRAEPRPSRRSSDREGSSDTTTEAPTMRAKPAPTKRTGGGTSGRPGGGRKRR